MRCNATDGGGPLLAGVRPNCSAAHEAWVRRWESGVYWSKGQPGWQHTEPHKTLASQRALGRQVTPG
jgi:hypothetical protein